MSKEAKERRLTEKEKIRKEKIAEKTKELEEMGYIRKDRIVSMVSANIMALVWVIPFILLFGGLFCLVNRNLTIYPANSLPAFANTIICLGCFIVLIVVHELIHGITWAHFAKGKWKSIEFGLATGSGTPYCTCLEPLKKSHYIIGGLMPFFILGVIPCIVGIIFNSGIFLFIGLVMIFGAGGDLTITAKMLAYRSEAKDVIIMDHPYECGFIVFERR